MASILYSDVRKGMVIIEEGQLCYVVDRELRTPGNLPSKLTLKLKNIKTGFVTDRRVHPEDKVEQAYLEKREMQYSYKDTDGYVFMDTENYDQETLSAAMVGDMMKYLKENNKVQVTFHDGKALSRRVASHGGAGGDGNRAGPEGGDGRRPVQAGHAGDGAEDLGPAVHPGRREDPRRYQRRQVPQPVQVSSGQWAVVSGQ